MVRLLFHTEEGAVRLCVPLLMANKDKRGSGRARKEPATVDKRVAKIEKAAEKKRLRKQMRRG